MKKVYLAVILAAAFFAAPASASAYLYLDEAGNKATTNTWNNFCAASWYACSVYPYVTDYSRINGSNVKVRVRTHHRSYGWCASWRYVREYSDGSKRVVESESGAYWCPG